MFISKTPYRLSFFGGGTDLPEWASKHGGIVVSSTIDKYCYISCKTLLPFYDYKYRLVYSQTEIAHAIHEIKHRGIRGVLDFLNTDVALEIHHDGDLPARAGLGSSSSFTVGLLHVIQTMLGTSPTKQQLAEDAIFIEQKINEEAVGAQDQVAASFGGFNKIVFFPDGRFEVCKVPLTRERVETLNNHMLLFFTGIQRVAPIIESDKVLNMEKKTKEYSSIMQLAETAHDLLLNENFSPIEFGALMHESWSIKKTLSNKVTNHSIDQIYETARSAGAIGGKLLGAGGGGFIALFVPPSKQKAVKLALSRLTCVDFAFESEGSSVMSLR